MPHRAVEHHHWTLFSRVCQRSDVEISWQTTSTLPSTQALVRFEAHRLAGPATTTTHPHLRHLTVKALGLKTTFSCHKLHAPTLPHPHPTLSSKTRKRKKLVRRFDSFTLSSMRVGTAGLRPSGSIPLGTSRSACYPELRHLAICFHHARWHIPSAFRSCVMHWANGVD